MDPSQQPTPDEWDELADRAACGLVRNRQRNRSLALRRYRWLWAAAALLLLALGYTSYRHWDNLAAGWTSLVTRMAAEVPWLRRDEDWPDADSQLDLDTPPEARDDAPRAPTPTRPGE